MTSKLVISFLLMLIVAPLCAQKIPANPNRVDKNGLRQGKWTIFFNEDFEPLDTASESGYYRLIEYRNDKPVGTVIDYYMSGIKQSEVGLFADRPEEINDGNATFYREDGTKEIVRTYDKGKQLTEIFFTRAGAITDQNFTTINNEALEAYRAGDYKKALDRWTLALPQAEIESGKNHHDYAEALNNLAGINQIFGNYQKAEQLFLEAVAINKRIVPESHPDYATAVSNLAAFYNTTGKFRASEEFQLEALRLRKKYLGPDHSLTSSSINKLGALYYATGNYVASEKMYQEALRIRGKTFGTKSIEYSNTLNNCAVLYSEMGVYVKARAMLKESVAIKQSIYGSRHPDYTLALMNLALIEKNEYNYARADSIFTAAKSIYQSSIGINNQDYSKLLSHMAELYDRMGKTKDSESYYDQALSLTLESFGENHTDIPIFQMHKALLYEKEKKFDKAASLLKVSNQGLLRQIEDYFPSLSEKEREAFYNAMVVNFDYFTSSALDRLHADPEVAQELYNNQLAIKGLLFTSNNRIRRAILASKNDSVIAIFRQWRINKITMARAFQMSKEELAEEQIDPAALAEETNKLEKQLSDRSQGFIKNKRVLHANWTDVKGQLKADEAAIETVRFKTLGIQRIVTDSSDHRLPAYKEFGLTDSVAYAALIVTSRSQRPEVVIIPNGNELEKKYISYYKNAMLSQTADLNSYNAFWKAIASNKALKKIHKIYFAPDGVYNSINLNSLLNPVSNKYLNAEKEIYWMTSTRDLLDKKTYGSTRSISFFGYPNYLRSATDSLNLRPLPDSLRHSSDAGVLSALPGTEVEIKSIERLALSGKWISTLYVGDQATEENLKNTTHADVLHIATHGFFRSAAQRGAFAGYDARQMAENPLLRSGLMLAGAQSALQYGCDASGDDGILTSFEAMNLQLDSTRLVVLSACETGLGQIRNGEGVYGLQRAFQTAGAGAVIMSLWKVNDKATQEFMTSFYGRWIRTGDMRQSFSDATNDLKRNYPHPYFWGAFVAVGQ